MRVLPTFGLLTACALLLLATAPASAQNAPARDDIVAALEKYQSDLELDVPALRQQVAERSKMRGRKEPPPQKRPPIAPELNNLPAFNLDIAFDVDTPIVQPESYQAVGRIADALVHSSLLPYTFLIVGHMEANGKREANAILSQRRADAIREILVNTFKISSKRIQSVGLGEEQLLDFARPTGPANNQIQIMTLTKIPEQTEQPATPAKKQPAKKKRK
ncbi:MAG: OmpA family protein [Bradyrhizobium sp.]|uniref:OmpA family protein n=1 Tax=Bradyrhizobium sp. TaxID=376 RepID=UPI003542433E